MKPLSDYLGDVTADEQEALIRFTPALEKYVADSVNEKFASVTQTPVISDHEKKYRNLLTAFHNNGRLPGHSKKVEWMDMVKADQKRMEDFRSGKIREDDFAFSDTSFFWNNPMLIPRLISSVVREPAEIESRLINLFPRIRLEGPHQSIAFPAVSTYVAGSLEVPEGGTYPEGKMEFGATITAKIGKYGIKVRFTDEMLRFSQFDIMAMYLRGAGIAMARNRESIAADHITGQGTTHFDNSDVAAAHTTGRDSSLLYNGTFSVYDLHTMYAAMVNDGFVPNTLIVNPMAWQIFMQDPTMRNWAYAQGPKMIWQKFQGEVAQMRQWAADPLNNSTWVTNPKEMQTTFTTPPELFPYPLNIVVSPYIPFNGTTNTTNIILCDANELGIFLVNEEPTPEEFRDPERDINNLKIRERWALAISNEGKAIRQAKNVIIARSYDVDDKVHLQITGSLPTGESAGLLALQS